MLHIHLFKMSHGSQGEPCILLRSETYKKTIRLEVDRELFLVRDGSLNYTIKYLKDAGFNVVGYSVGAMCKYIVSTTLKNI